LSSKLFNPRARRDATSAEATTGYADVELVPFQAQRLLEVLSMSVINYSALWKAVQFIGYDENGKKIELFASQTQTPPQNKGIGVNGRAEAYGVLVRFWDVTAADDLEATAAVRVLE